MIKRIISVFLVSLLLISGIFASPPPVEMVYYTEENALKTLFSTQSKPIERTLDLSEAEKSQIEKLLGWKLNSSTFRYFEGQKSAGADPAYAFVIDEMGKHYPMTMMVTVDKDVSVQSVVMMVYREKIGWQVKKKRFMSQFAYKNLSNPIAVDEDITGISGATVSSWAVAAGVRKALALTTLLVKNT